MILYLVTTPHHCPTLPSMAGQKPYEPNDPPQQPRFKLPKETDAMPDAPTSKSPTHEQLRQQSHAQQSGQTPQPQSGGNIQNILAYFASQGVTDDHVVATIGGFPLKLSELKASGQSQSQNHPLPSPPKTEHKKNEHEERKRPSKSEENDS